MGGWAHSQKITVLGLFPPGKHFFSDGKYVTNPAPWMSASSRGMSSGAPEEEAPVRNGHRYLTNRIDCLDYPRALKLGLPIGSGMIESGHRHVLQARLKKAGAAWLHDHADQIAHLRVLRANHQWESFWN